MSLFDKDSEGMSKFDALLLFLAMSFYLGLFLCIALGVRS